MKGKAAPWGTPQRDALPCNEGLVLTARHYALSPEESDFKDLTFPCSVLTQRSQTQIHTHTHQPLLWISDDKNMFKLTFFTAEERHECFLDTSIFSQGKTAHRETGKHSFSFICWFEPQVPDMGPEQVKPWVWFAHEWWSQHPPPPGLCCRRGLEWKLVSVQSSRCTQRPKRIEEGCLLGWGHLMHSFWISTVLSTVLTQSRHLVAFISLSEWMSYSLPRREISS